ncbi:MAG: hypothetical protein UR46_C0017G0001, partial [Parcubacteria group bacterium GW2011_GWA1_33_6]
FCKSFLFLIRYTVSLIPKAERVNNSAKEVIHYHAHCPRYDYVRQWAPVFKLLSTLN